MHACKWQPKTQDGCLLHWWQQGHEGPGTVELVCCKPHGPSHGPYHMSCEHPLWYIIRFASVEGLPTQANRDCTPGVRTKTCYTPALQMTSIEKQVTQAWHRTRLVLHGSLPPVLEHLHPFP